MSTIQPVDLPQVRDDAIRYVKDDGADLYKWAIEHGRQDNYPVNMSPRDAGERIAQLELSRLRLAELYYVTANMMRLSHTAADSLPEFHLTKEDLPSSHGLIIFETPIRNLPQQRNTRGEMVDADLDIIAATWGPFYDSSVPAIWVTWWTDTRKTYEKHAQLGDITPEQARQALLMTGAIAIDHEVQLLYGTHYDTSVNAAEYENVGETAEAVRSMLVLRTIWTLLQQPALVKDSILEMPRSARRRYARKNIPVSPVRVISLRHAVAASDGTGESRDYHHQWIVRGHWRRQWHPGRKEHRPIWIAPHIKGPEGAPLLGGEKVYALRK